MQRLTSIWTTPGFTDEVIHLYLASGLTAATPSRERDEFIEVAPQPLSQVLARIRDGEVRDAKTVVAILYMAGFVLGCSNLLSPDEDDVSARLERWIREAAAASTLRR